MVDSLASYEDITFDLFSHTLDVFQEPKLGKEVLHSCNSNFASLECKRESGKRILKENIFANFIFPTILGDEISTHFSVRFRNAEYSQSKLLGTGKRLLLLSECLRPEQGVSKASTTPSLIVSESPDPYIHQPHTFDTNPFLSNMAECNM